VKKVMMSNTLWTIVLLIVIAVKVEKGDGKKVLKTLCDEKWSSKNATSNVNSEAFCKVR